MPGEEFWIPENAPAATSPGVAAIARPSADKITTTTADPGTGGASLAVTARDRFPQSGSFRIRVLGTSGVPEIMLVTAGQGTGAGSFTVTRGADPLTPAGVAHSVGASVALVEAVQIVTPEDARRIVTFKGRTATFRTPGRAGTAGQKIFALHNATGSTVLVDVHKITVDMVQTVIKAITVLPPVIRAWKFTAVPTNGTPLAKNSEDSALASNASVTAWGDASADGTVSGTPLAVTLPAGTFVTQEYAPRFITGAGYEPMDRAEFFAGDDEWITLRALEGIAVFVDYTLATQNPVTDMWVATGRWVEYRAL